MLLLAQLQAPGCLGFRRIRRQSLDCHEVVSICSDIRQAQTPPGRRVQPRHTVPLSLLFRQHSVHSVLPQLPAQLPPPARRPSSR